MSKRWLGVPLLIVIVLILGVAWQVTSPQWAWLCVAALLTVFMMILGQAIAGRAVGILITEQNVISLARFQAVLWTVIVISAYFVIAIARIRHGLNSTPGEPVDPLKIILNNQLLGLLGISASALVFSPLIAATKKSKTADTGDTQAVTKDSLNADTARTTVTMTGADNKAQGILFKNSTINDARFTDIFEGDEVGNNNHVDLGKVQMFYFTIVVALAYAAAIWTMLQKDNFYGADCSFPLFSDGMVALLGISNAGYLANKGVDHTKKVNE